MTVFASVAWALCASAGLAQQFDFNVPSDDRWHYPFNFNPGTRPVGTCFGAAGLSGFNDRDGIVLVAWDTSSAIAPGQGAASYSIASIQVTLRNAPDAAWPIDLTTDEWFTYDVNGDTILNGDGIPRGQPGDTDGESDDADPGRPLELFGMGFSDNPLFDATTWNEGSQYIGSDSTVDTPRNPFPFVFRDGALDLLHVEDNVKGFDNSGLSPPFCSPDDSHCPFTPTPWATGVPVGYTPGAQPTPFDVTFEVDLDLSDGRVREYFQQQLDAGRVLVAVTTLRETEVMGEQSGFPTFYMKESIDVGAAPARLTIVLAACAPGDGDIDCDGDLDATDGELFVNTLLGVETNPDYIQRSDLNASGAPDGRDVQPFVNLMMGG